MMCWLMCAGMAVIMGLQVLVVFLLNRQSSWVRRNLVPWFVSVSRFINPDRK